MNRPCIYLFKFKSKNKHQSDPYQLFVIDGENSDVSKYKFPFDDDYEIEVKKMEDIDGFKLMPTFYFREKEEIDPFLKEHIGKVKKEYTKEQQVARARSLEQLNAAIRRLEKARDILCDYNVEQGINELTYSIVQAQIGADILKHKVNWIYPGEKKSKENKEE